MSSGKCYSCRPLHHALSLWHLENVDSLSIITLILMYFIIIKIIGGAQAVKTVVGAVLIFVGAREQQ